MLTLFILRHAQADWPQGTDDKDRPLGIEGLNQANMLADHMQKNDIKPDFILCSSANRTRQTLKPVLDHWPEIDVSYKDTLYLASAIDLFKEIQQVDNKYSSVLIIAHNPGIHSLVNSLIGHGKERDVLKVRTGYNAGCLSVLKCKTQNWETIELGDNELQNVIQANELSGI